jgi:AraC-like DNA-binding protein
MNAFNELATAPGLRQLLDLVWRIFGVNPALVSMDGQRIVIFDKESRAQPFCHALGEQLGGRELCTMCDHAKFLEARRDGQALRYRCHAGLREFIIPIIRGGQTIALLQCGQVHDRKPSQPEWQEASKSLKAVSLPVQALRPLFWRNRVLTPAQQSDLLELLVLVAERLSGSDQNQLHAPPGHAQAALGRAMTYIESHLAERITIDAVATAANASTRSLMRLFRQRVGASVVEFVQRRRVARALKLLGEGGRTCAEVAFECGFGSVQHFNRVFRRLENMSPTEWCEANR